MFCSNCGNKLEDKMKYCPRCGQYILNCDENAAPGMTTDSQETPETVDSTLSQQKEAAILQQEKKFPVKAAVLIFAAILVVLIICVVSGSSGSNLVGTWTVHRGYDSQTIILRSDKTFLTNDGYDTESGTWQLKNGKELIFDFDQSGTVYVTIEDITSTSMVWEVSDGRGSTNILTLTKTS